jgi:twitching motility protein PilJ
MKLRNKVLLVLGLGFVGLSASFFIISKVLLTQGYARLENQKITQDVQRVLDTVSKDLDSLSRQVRDYSQWNDTYEFIANENQSYIETNFVDSYIVSLGINAIVYVNNSGKVVFAQGADLVQSQEIPVSKTLLNHLKSSSPLLAHPDPSSKLAGILQLPEGPMLVASSPIVTSDGKGPIRGSLIMGRYVDAEYVQQLKELTKLPDITLVEFNAEQLPTDLRAVQQGLAAGNASMIRPLNQDSVAGYALLKDISDNPAFILRIIEPRDIYAQGQASSIYLLLALLLTGAIFSGAIILLLEKYILSRLSHLSDSVSRIGERGISHERIALSGGDELSNLANTFNFVLDQLQSSQASLQNNAERLQRHNLTIAQLSHDGALEEGNALQAAKTFVEATAETLDVERVSVWLYSSDRSQLTCLDLYERTFHQHSAGMQLQATSFPSYFAALFQNEPIVVQDVSTAPQFVELKPAYLAPYQICSLLILPIQTSGQTIGVIHCEQVGVQRQWRPEEQTFVYSIANLISLALESKTLQGEVGHLLDVVSAMSNGDLTVQAQVSDRLTGLVSDTLNHLTERLSQVLNQVLHAADQVSAGANQQKELATTVATNAQQQAEAVTRVLYLTEQVEQTAQDSTAQVNAASESLRTVAKTVIQGQDAMDNLTQSIQVLRQGSEQMEQRMRILGEFVGLADQFVQEQGQTAAITQALALNASLVAARASEQTDPRQFVVLSREFSSIADQVNRVAQQTHEGSVTLEQRSAQIHSVVSAIDAEVQNLGELVRGFMQGVEQSNQVFSNVQTITDEAVRAGESVGQMNQSIVSVAQSTAQVMRDIAQLADRTANLTQISREQSDRIDFLASQLLQTVQFFQLPAPETNLTVVEERLDLSQVAAMTVNVSSEEIQSEDGPLENISSVEMPFNQTQEEIGQSQDGGVEDGQVEAMQPEHSVSENHLNGVMDSHPVDNNPVDNNPVDNNPVDGETLDYPLSFTPSSQT